MKLAVPIEVFPQSIFLPAHPRPILSQLTRDNFVDFFLHQQKPLPRHADDVVFLIQGQISGMKQDADIPVNLSHRLDNLFLIFLPHANFPNRLSLDSGHDKIRPAFGHIVGQRTTAEFLQGPVKIHGNNILKKISLVILKHPHTVARR